MARIVTDPNYSSPTFSRATAATDLFKKEDVQNLAAAVSTHDHSTGKGLALGNGVITAAMLASGAVGSAQILDGSIMATDIADGQIINSKLALPCVARENINARAVSIPYTANAVTSSPSTSSASSSLIPEMTLSIDSYPQGRDFLCMFVGSMFGSVAGVWSTFNLLVDGAQNVGAQQVFGTPYIAAGQPFYSIYTVTLVGIVGVGAGAHTVAAYWATNGGTLTNDGGRRNLYVWEIFK